MHREDAGYDPLFAFGYGLTYADKGDLAPLSEAHPANATREDGMIFGRGKLPANWSFDLAEPHGVGVPVKGNSGATGNGVVRISGVDRSAQEDARAVVWGAAGGTLRVVADKPIDMSRESNAQYSLVIDYRVDTAPVGAVRLGMQCGDTCAAAVPLTATLRSAPVGQWTTLTLPLNCFVQAGLDPKRVTAPFTLESDGALALSISGVRYTSAGAGGACPQ